MVIFLYEPCFKNKQTINNKQKAKGAKKSMVYIPSLTFGEDTHEEQHRGSFRIMQACICFQVFLKQNLIKSLTVITFKATKYYTCIYLLIIQVIDKNLKADVRSNTLPYSIRYTTIPRFIHE